MTCRISAPVDWIGKFPTVRGLMPDGHCMTPAERRADLKWQAGAIDHRLRVSSRSRETGPQPRQDLAASNSDMPVRTASERIAQPVLNSEHDCLEQGAHGFVSFRR